MPNHLGKWKNSVVDDALVVNGMSAMDDTDFKGYRISYSFSKTERFFGPPISTLAVEI